MSSVDVEIQRAQPAEEEIERLKEEHVQLKEQLEG